MSTPGFLDGGGWSLSNIITIQTVVRLTIAWLAYQLLKALYNVSAFHPLSHIPGPKLAAATYLPEFYYDVIKFGRYTREIKEMHKTYGPLVRINPYEIHCSDINFSDEIYAVGGRKRDKPKHQVGGTVINLSEFGTGDHELHRARRAPVAKFFSRSNVAKLEGEIKEHVQMLCDKLLRHSGREPFDVKTAYSCFTADVISSYSFGQSFGFLDQDGWYPNFKDPTEAALQTSHFFRFFPFLKHLDQVATWIVDFLPNDVALFIRTMQIEIPASINQTRENVEAGLIRSEKRPTIFGSLLLEEELQSTEKGTKRLAAEGFAILGAGTETTASALAVITYHLLTKPHLLLKLTAELERSGFTNSPRELPAFPDLEKLPYLGAVIQEGLRLSYGVASRTARIATEEDLVYRGEWNKKRVEFLIPRGYAVGMSTYITHHDETLFPNSDDFIPERWLDDQNNRRKEVEKGQMAFSKGSRKCLAMNLALCEIHFVVAALAMRVFPRMTLFETTQDDVLYDHDMFIPMVKAGSKGIRVMVQ